MKVVIGILAAFLIALAGFQLYALFRARRNRGRAVIDIPGAPGVAVTSGRKVTVYAWSPDCSSCRAQTPIIDRLSTEFPDIFKVNVIDDQRTAARLGVPGTPSTIIFEHGVVKEFFVGVKTAESLRRVLR